MTTDRLSRWGRWGHRPGGARVVVLGCALLVGLAVAGSRPVTLAALVGVALGALATVWTRHAWPSGVGTLCGLAGALAHPGALAAHGASAGALAVALGGLLYLWLAAAAALDRTRGWVTAPPAPSAAVTRPGWSRRTHRGALIGVAAGAAALALGDHASGHSLPWRLAGLIALVVVLALALRRPSAPRRSPPRPSDAPH